MVSKRTPPLSKSKAAAILSKLTRLPSPTALLSTAASAAATTMFLRSLAKNYLPSQLNTYLHSKLHHLLSSLFTETTILIYEYDALNKNKLFSAAALYVGAVAGPSAVTCRASLPPKEKHIDVAFCGGEEVSDEFQGIPLKWRLVTKEVQPRTVRNSGDHSTATVTEVRYFRLSFEKEHKNKIVDEYLPYVLERSETLKREKKTLKLHTLMHHPYYWESVNLDHPSTFETLAMDDGMKKMIVEDLDRFLKRKELYRKVGKAWKRGYLLYGPPGTGKSSLIAAMANYLRFDVYDLELSAISCNSQLRNLLITTANRSILMVEDIDASIDLSERKSKAPPTTTSSSHRRANNPKVTLSGILNFIDGLWSSIGDERVIIFTTNHIEKLDKALLRPGRMDLHINMSYCTPCGLKLLAKNYLGITDPHPLVLKAEEMIASSSVTPAQIGEQLLKSDDPDLALEGLIEFLEHKRLYEESLKLKEKSESCDDVLTKLGKTAEALPLETRQEILRKEETVNAFKTLNQLLESGNVNSCEGKNVINIDE